MLVSVISTGFLCCLSLWMTTPREPCVFRWGSSPLPHPRAQLQENLLQGCKKIFCRACGQMHPVLCTYSLRGRNFTPVLTAASAALKVLAWRASVVTCLKCVASSAPWKLKQLSRVTTRAAWICGNRKFPQKLVSDAGVGNCRQCLLLGWCRGRAHCLLSCTMLDFWLR